MPKDAVDRVPRRSDSGFDNRDREVGYKGRRDDKPLTQNKDDRTSQQRGRVVETGKKDEKQLDEKRNVNIYSALGEEED